MPKTHHKRFIAITACILLVSLQFIVEASTIMQKAKTILKATKTQGGMIVHIGCRDGGLVTALGVCGNFLIHGLDADPTNVSRAREHITSLDMYGRVSIDRLRSTLPYIDNLVNLIVMENLQVPKEEIMRVLVPGGRAYLAGTVVTKPFMTGIDDWTHFMHDSTGNAVANDTVVSPPKYLKWVGGPRWAKNHGLMGSMMGLVAANGRIFSIVDEGYVGKDQTFAAPGWMLIARDAYNGAVLWSKPIEKWHSSFWRLKSGPAQLPERIVADANRLYVTLDINGPVSALDPATGKRLYVCEESVGTEEILVNNGVLFLLRNPDREDGKHTEPVRNDKGEYSGVSPYGEYPKEIMAVNAATGKVLWQKKSVVVAMTLAADDHKVYFHNGDKIVCLDRNNGSRKWTSPPVARLKPVPANFTPTLIAYKDVVLFAGGKGEADREEDMLSAYDGNSGKKLWEIKQSKAYKAAPLGLFAINDLVWMGEVSGGGGGTMNPYTGYDIHTGKAVKTFKRDIEWLGSHSRCYRNKATVNYIFPNLRGVEMADIHNEEWTVDVWVRGGCSYGIVPSHGMIYTSPHACVCYAQSLLKGFRALYGDAANATRPGLVTERLIKGEAYNAHLPILSTSQEQAGTSTVSGEWSTYRSNNQRSSYVKTTVKNSLSFSWKAKLGGKLSALTIADGRVYVSQIDNHTLNAIDKNSGNKLWSFKAGGRIDSPPTIYKGNAYFGCTDGYVYCLDASSGKLVWKFLAAADDRRLVVNGQLESIHPVHGSVLIRDNTIYCIAGRSMFLDGGLRLYKLNPDTGEQISLNVMNEIDPTTGEALQLKSKGQNQPPSIPDILSSDDKFIYMGVQQIDLGGKRTQIYDYAPDRDKVFQNQKGEGVHLFSPSGFLDNARFHRNYWLYGKVYYSGNQGEWRAGSGAPAGNILAFNDTDVLGYYGYLIGGKMKDSLISIPKDPQAKGETVAPRNRGKGRRDRKGTSSTRKKGGTIELIYNWTSASPIYVNSIAIAHKTLLLGGSTVDDEESFLYLYSVKEGQELAKFKLPATPVFDGMAVAGGGVYVALKDGSVVCLK